MSRPITLFTGQWADLPFEEVAKLAAEWGYDGLEIACSGDHLDVARGAVDDHYIANRREILDRHGLQVFAISAHLQGQAVCDDPIDQRHRGILNSSVWGDGDPEGVRQRAAEAVKNAARTAARLGVSTVVGFTGSSIWKYIAMFPPASRRDDRRRLPGLRRPVEPDPGRLRRGRRPVRPRGPPLRDRLRLLLHAARAGGDRAPASLRDQLGPFAHGVAEHRPGAVHLGLPRPDLPRGLQGHQSPAAGRPPRSARVAPALGRSHGVGGTSCPPAAAMSTGKTASGCSPPSATTGPSASNGKTPAWTGCTVRQRPWPTSAPSFSTHRPPPSTPPSRTRTELQSQPPHAKPILDGVSVLMSVTPQQCHSTPVPNDALCRQSPAGSPVTPNYVHRDPGVRASAASRPTRPWLSNQSATPSPLRLNSVGRAVRGIMSCRRVKCTRQPKIGIASRSTAAPTSISPTDTR